MTKIDVLDLVRRWERDAAPMPMVDILRMAASEIARLREERRWISVGERLPEEDVHVFAWHSGDECPRVAYRTYGIWKTVAFNHFDDVSIVVTHWRPMPPGPEGDG
jgi:Protein of unknown function (DUF551)